MRKQLITKMATSMVLTILIMATTLSFASEKTFSDINNHWANKNIVALQNKKLINGYPDGTFKPDSTMTRAEFITVMLRSLGIQKADVEGEWYAGYLAKVNQYSYIQDNNNIINEKLEKPITRLEATTIFANIITNPYLANLCRIVFLFIKPPPIQIITYYYLTVVIRTKIKLSL